MLQVFDREDDLLRKQRREFEKRQRLRRQKEERHEVSPLLLLSIITSLL